MALTDGPLSLSQPYTLRLTGIRYNADGGPSDPRSLFTPEFQLVPLGATAFGTWVAGTWDSTAPPGGPFSARFTIGPGQPTSLNPGTPGVFRVKVRYFQATGETPVFDLGTVTLAAP